jgi:chorismate synthase
LPVSLEAIDRELWRRQQGFGRGGRMKIETDRAHIVSGVRHSMTIGSPIAIPLEGDSDRPNRSRSVYEMTD